MKKKIVLGFLASVIIVSGVVAMSAFEAHVINVTARIENALSVTPEHIMFGTVFPQEEINKNVKITLSESFMLEERVDDVKYTIKQKPKPRPEAVEQYFNGNVVHARDWCHSNWGYRDGDIALGEQDVDYFAICYYNLCPYLSKHSPDGNDKSVDAFHPMETDASGYLSKKDGDTEDVWTIDLKVPCFAGYCDQGYFDWVRSINDAVDPHDYMLDPELEHEDFGCDLWIEINGISRSNKIGIYKEADDYPDGDPNNVLGDRIGMLEYDANKESNNLDVHVEIDDDSWISPNGQYVLVLNGPRTGSVADGFTNELLASKACQTYPDGWDGWWSNRATDNTGTTDKDCDGYDDDDPTIALTRQEGYYNFEIGVSGQDLIDGYDTTLNLLDGNYNEVQFLIKDMGSDWSTVGEYPGAGEIDGLTSYFDFEI